jgi:hypothetical protein
MRWRPSGRFHLAIVSPDRETVGRFHAAALEASRRDSGAPRLRRLCPRPDR